MSTADTAIRANVRLLGDLLGEVLVEQEGQPPRESLAEALQLLEGADVEEAVQRLSVELVLTAHPTEATRRTVLAKHRHVAALLRELDDPDLPPSAEARVRRDLAEEI